jgi:hypothetical protein
MKSKRECAGYAQPLVYKNQQHHQQSPKNGGLPYQFDPYAYAEHGRLPMGLAWQWQQPQQYPPQPEMGPSESAFYMNPEGHPGQTSYMISTATPNFSSFASTASSNNDIRPWQPPHMFPSGVDPTLGYSQTGMGYSPNANIDHATPFTMNAHQSMFLEDAQDTMVPISSAPPLAFLPQRSTSYVHQPGAPDADFEQGTWLHTDFHPHFVTC